MKNVSLLLLLILSALLFTIGLFIPGTGNLLHIFFITAGFIAVLIFYILSFRKIFHDKSLSRGLRIFWIVAIVCLPMIGNMFYLVLSATTSGPQIVKSDSAY